MSIKVIGAGVGRTGTHSLKLALETLLAEPCYHMAEVFQHMDHVPHWQAAADGTLTDWNLIFDGYGAAVDWPVASFWSEVSEAYPDALIILSVRDPESWWTSASNTIFKASGAGPPEELTAWKTMVETMFRNRFTAEIDNKDACLAAFDKHYEHALETIPKDRLLIWSASEGWGPLCEALGAPVPDQPFPHSNTSEEFNARHFASAN